MFATTRTAVGSVLAAAVVVGAVVASSAPSVRRAAADTGRPTSGSPVRTPTHPLTVALRTGAARARVVPASAVAVTGVGGSGLLLLRGVAGTAPAAIGSRDDAAADEVTGTAITADGSSILIAEHDASVGRLAPARTPPAFGAGVDLSGFTGEGGATFEPYSLGVGTAGGAAIVAVGEQGVVQLIQRDSRWVIDTRVHAGGRTSAGGRHRPGFIPFAGPTARTFDGVVVGQDPLRDGRYQALVIDRRQSTLAAVTGVGTPAVRMAGEATDPAFGALGGPDDGTGALAVSALAPARAVVVTPSGLAVVSLRDPAHPYVRNRTTVSGPEATSVALAPDGNDAFLAVGDTVRDYTGVLDTPIGHPLRWAHSLVPAAGVAVVDVASVGDGSLVVTYGDPVDGYRLAVVARPTTGRPSVTGGLTLPGGADAPGTLSVWPAQGAATLVPTRLPSSLRTGRRVDIAVAVTGGAGSYKLAVTSGALPSGLRLTGSRIVGVPRSAAVRHIVITASNAYGGAVSQAYTVVVRSA